MQTPVPASEFWPQWAIQCLMNGMDEAEISHALETQAGWDKAACRKLFEEAREHPAFRAGLQVARERRKLEWLLRVYHHSYNQSAFTGTIERRANVSAEEFIERYYSANRPVILTETMKNWDILANWTWDHLAEKFGALETEIQRYEQVNGKQEYIMDRMPFSRFVSRIQEPDCPSDLYMTAYNAASNRKLLNTLIDDLPELPPFLDSRAPREQIMMWIGPKGTMGRFHIDMANSFLAQVKGSKDIRIVPSFSLPYVYHEFATVSSLNLDDWDEQHFPMFKYVPVIRTTLQPGEMLFIPIGWWHQVRALDPSISITFTNFTVDNQYFSTEEIYSPQPK